MNNYASYEKEIISKVTRIKHTIRIRLNKNAIDVIETIKRVPPNASVAMIVGDDENNGYGEIIFEEEIPEE